MSTWPPWPSSRRVCSWRIEGLLPLPEPGAAKPPQPKEYRPMIIEQCHPVAYIEIKPDYSMRLRPLLELLQDAAVTHGDMVLG
jgi:hypothetical protein